MSSTSLENAPTPTQAETQARAETRWCADALASLCRVDTTSGHERAILPTLVPLLESMAARVTQQIVEGDRVNILATWGQPRVLLTTHLDTVPPYLPPRPVEGGLAGRGTVDAKGQIVAQLAVIRRLLVAGQSGFAWLGVSGEETDAGGAKAAAHRFGASRDGASSDGSLGGLEAIVGGEPTENQLVTAQMGFVHLVLRCRGRAGHGAVGTADDNALWRLIAWLETLRTLPMARDAEFGSERFNLGRLEGGEAGNVIASRAEAELTVRTVPNSSFVDRCRAHAPADAEVVVRLEESPCRFGATTALPSAIGTGHAVPFGSDLPRLAALIADPEMRALQCFLLGPGSIADAHTDEEWLSWNALSTGIDRIEMLVDGVLRRPHGGER